jgi:hypothetical protein
LLHALRRFAARDGEGLIGIRDVPSNSPASIRRLSRLLLGAARLQRRKAPLQDEQPEAQTDEGIGSCRNRITRAAFSLSDQLIPFAPADRPGGSESRQDTALVTLAGGSPGSRTLRGVAPLSCFLRWVFGERSMKTTNAENQRKGEK